LSNAGRQRKKVNNQSGFLDISISDPSVNDFYVITYYDNGERDKVWFRRPAIIKSGRYLLELNRHITSANSANLLSVFIEPTQATEQSVSMEVSLCQ